MANKTEKGLSKEIEIPEGIEAKIEGNALILKKDSKEIKRKINADIKITKEDKKIILKIRKSTKPNKRNLGTIEGHIKNMIEGLNKEYEYELEICNVHFPMVVDFNKDKKEISIKNMLGEKYPRVLKLSDKVEISIKAPKIMIKSYDLEAAGQAAANLEKVSKIRNRDRNKFQDGIFITKKPGRES